MMRLPRSCLSGAGIAVLLGLFFPRCEAAEPGPRGTHLQLSLGTTLVRGDAGVLDLSVIETAHAPSHSFWQLGMQVIGHSSFHGDSVDHNIVWRGLLSRRVWHLDVGIGLSYMLNPRPYNGSHLNAALQLDYVHAPLVVSYIHESNAGIRSPNYGRDSLLIGWRF